MKNTTALYVQTMLKKSPSLMTEQTTLLQAIELICRCFTEGHALFVCGNGGSASDAEHIVGELVKAFRKERPLTNAQKEQFAALYPKDAALAEKLQRGFPAYSLVSSCAILTATLNDIGGEYVYAQQVNACVREGDVVIGISTSGNSLPVQNALKVAKFKGASTIAMTGKGGGAMAALADVTLRSPETETYLVQQDHIALYHILCAAVEEDLI